GGRFNVPPHPFGLGTQHLRSLVGEPVVAPQSPVNNLLTVNGHQTIVTKSIQRPIERARAQRHSTIGKRRNLSDDGVPVERLACERREDQKSRLAKRSGHDDQYNGYEAIPATKLSARTAERATACASGG